MSQRSKAKYNDLGTLDAGNLETPMILSEDFRNAIFSLEVLGGGSGVVKFFTSNQDPRDKIRPDLSLPVSDDNEYSAIQVVDLQDGAYLPGNDGVSIVADGVFKYEINQNAQSWVGIKADAGLTGSIKVRLLLADNQ